MAQDTRIIGLLCMVASLQFVATVLVSESLTPGYDPNVNFISDLGVGEAAFIFNPSLIVAGLIIIAVAFRVKKQYSGAIPFAAVALTGISLAATGIFTEDAGLLHSVFSYAAIGMGIALSLGSYRFSPAPFSYASALGAFSLVAGIFFVSGIHFGFGTGFMERLVVYPLFLWAAIFGIGKLVEKNKK